MHAGSASPLPPRVAGLTVALACEESAWPHEDWPGPQDPFVGRTVPVPPPYRSLDPRHREAVDAVVLRCQDPVDAFRSLRSAVRDAVPPVVVVSPCRDPEAIVEVFRGGAGYLVDGDYDVRMLSRVVVGAVIGHTHLSPIACTAVRESCGQRAETPPDTAGRERLRAALAPRERQVLELLSTGLSAREIAVRLSLAERTVRNNLCSIYTKLDVRSSREAVLLWLGASPWRAGAELAGQRIR